MKSDTAMGKGLAFFVLMSLVLILSLLLLLAFFSDPLLSLVLLGCVCMSGTAILAGYMGRTGRPTISEREALASRAPRLPRIKPTSMPHVRRAQPSKVRCRIERWEMQRRMAVDEPLSKELREEMWKTLRKAHSRVCPCCGSRAANACTCRYRMRSG